MQCHMIISLLAMHTQFLHWWNQPFLRCSHCKFCLNLHIILGDVEENVCGFSEHSVLFTVEKLGVYVTYLQMY